MSTALGCGPLSMAVIANDVDQVKNILKHHPSALNERNCFGYNPLHLAADKPACLRLLTQAATNKNVLKQKDANGDTPFKLALKLGSEVHVKKKCRRCSCAECSVILLQADCAVSTEDLHRVLSDNFPRCKTRFIRALKDRRDRLKQLALKHLTVGESEQFGLFSDAVLDRRAFQVVQLLQQRGVYVPEALRVEERDTSVFENVNDPSDAELFYRLGFRDTDACLDAQKIPMWFLELPYIGWLHNHGVDAYFSQLESKSCRGLFTAHRTCVSISQSVYFRQDVLTNDDSSNDGWLQHLPSMLLRPDLTDDCRCRCSIGGCTPLTFLLRELCNMVPWQMEYGVSAFLNTFHSRLDTHHYIAALRFLTFHFLGIPHLCGSPPDHICGRTKDWDADEFEDEHAYELEVLETLLKEFQSEIMKIAQDSRPGLDELLDFWKNTWKPRMRETREHLDGNNLSDAERQRGEEIGVVWDRPVPPSTASTDRDSGRILPLNHWICKLNEIEAEYQ